MQIIETIIAIVLSWIWVAYLLGGLITWLMLMIIVAQLIYNNDGERAANWAAWIAFFLVLLGAGSIGYLLLGDQWIEIVVLTVTAVVPPLIGTIWVTASE